MVTQMSNTAVILEMRKKKTSHLLHFILTMCTGVWLFVWVAVAIMNRIHNNGIDEQINRVMVLESSKN